jgi:uncharacterized protein YlaI
MEVKCLVCGQGDKVEKWQPEYDKVRHAAGTTSYICDACQTKLKAEHHAKTKKSNITS